MNWLTEKFEKKKKKIYLFKSGSNKNFLNFP
jgi:hypothetical protein